MAERHCLLFLHPTCTTRLAAAAADRKDARVSRVAGKLADKSKNAGFLAWRAVHRGLVAATALAFPCAALGRV